VGTAIEQDHFALTSRAHAALSMSSRTVLARR
jgi:hypothetical protein